MSQIITNHEEEKCIKCPKCDEDMYNFSAGVLRCPLCDYEDDSF